MWHVRLPRDADYLARCFLDLFTARDIGEEPLVFDEGAPGPAVREALDEIEAPAALLLCRGRRVGFCRREKLDDGPCGDALEPLAPEVMLDDDARLVDVILALSREPFFLLRGYAGVTGLVHRADLQKPPVRMWLFGFLSITELRWAWLIERTVGDSDEWRRLLSPGRLAMAERLLQERLRAGLRVRLIDCLQFGDRAALMLKHPLLWERMVYETKGQARQGIRLLQRLRDHLAHSQDILDADWPTIVGLAEATRALFALGADDDDPEAVRKAIARALVGHGARS